MASNASVKPRTLGSDNVNHANSPNNPNKANAIEKRDTTANPGAQGRIRTSVARKERQVYSLLPLTARPPVQMGRVPRCGRQRKREHSSALQYRLTGSMM